MPSSSNCETVSARRKWGWHCAVSWQLEVASQSGQGLISDFKWGGGSRNDTGSERPKTTGSFDWSGGFMRCKRDWRGDWTDCKGLEARLKVWTLPCGKEKAQESWEEWFRQRLKHKAGRRGKLGGTRCWMTTHQESLITWDVAQLHMLTQWVC